MEIFFGMSLFNIIMRNVYPTLFKTIARRHTTFSQKILNNLRDMTKHKGLEMQSNIRLLLIILKHRF